MNRESILNQLQEDNNILSLPQVLADILEVIGREDFNADDLCRIILRDPALTARVLKMSNSSFYNRYAEIKTVHQAVSMMGVSTVKCLALSTSIFKPDVISQKSGISPKDFFHNTLKIATTAQRIAQEISFKSPEEAFIAGLLHDIGVLYFIQQHSSEYKKMLSTTHKNKSLSNAELTYFGIGHAEISRYLVEKWNLPKEIVKAIGHHHELNQFDPEDVLSNILKLSVLMTKENFSGFSVEDNPVENISKLSEILEIDQVQINKISNLVIEDSHEIANYLNIDIGSYDDMLKNANQEIWKAYHVIDNLFRERQELSKSILEEEHKRGAIESKNIAMATMSHYINNAVMAIYGRSQLLQMQLKKNNHDQIIENLPEAIQKINSSVKKIVAVLEEMKRVSPVDHEKLTSVSIAMDLDKLIEKRMKEIDIEAYTEKAETV